MPERGRIGLFNRSYYEEVLIVRVHPELLANEVFRRRCSKVTSGRSASRKSAPMRITWRKPGSQSASSSSTSRKEHLLERLDRSDKHWNLNSQDVHERSTATTTCMLMKRWSATPQRRSRRGTSCRRTRSGLRAWSRRMPSSKRSIHSAWATRDAAKWKQMEQTGAILEADDG